MCCVVFLLLWLCRYSTFFCGSVSYNKLVKLESASVEPLRKLHTLNISGNIQMDLYDIREAFQVISLCKFRPFFSRCSISLVRFDLFMSFVCACLDIYFVFGSFDARAVRIDDAMRLQIDLYMLILGGGGFDSSSIIIVIIVWPTSRPLAN